MAPVVLMTALVLIWSLVAAVQPAGAGGSVKQYTLSVCTPPPAGAGCQPNPSVAAGSTSTYLVTLTNSASSTIALGAADLTVDGTHLASLSLACGNPCALTSSGGKAWTAALTAAGVIQLRATAGTQKLPPADSLSVPLTATVGCGIGTFDVFSSAIAWPATSPGTSTFTLVGTAPTVTVVAGAGTPTRLAITALRDGAGAELPHSADRALWLVLTGQTVGVVVQAQDASGAPAPACSAIGVTLRKGSASSTTVLGTGTIATGQTDVTIQITDAVLETFDLYATASGLTDDHVTVSVQKTIVQAAGTPGTSLCLSTGTCPPGSAASAASARPPSAASSVATDPCDTNATSTTCVTVTLPNGTNGTAILALGSCSGLAADCNSLMITFLADLKSSTGGNLYTLANPFLMEIECDKTRCGGSGVNSFVVSIDELNNGTFVDSPACPSNDQTGIDPSLGTNFCTDYAGSHRDGAGDLILDVRLALDARGKI